jgi:DNA-binding transcriptional LysR family regulator
MNLTLDERTKIFDKVCRLVATELNFTRAADRLHITQSGFSKQINEVEAKHGFHLFIRKNKKNVELTEVGRIFVEEARLALLHIDRAVHAAREGSDTILTVGHSPDADEAWISAILATRLPMHPNSAFCSSANSHANRSGA